MLESASKFQNYSRKGYQGSDGINLDKMDQQHKQYQSKRKQQYDQWLLDIQQQRQDQALKKQKLKQEQLALALKDEQNFQKQIQSQKPAAIKEEQQEQEQQSVNSQDLQQQQQRQLDNAEGFENRAIGDDGNSFVNIDVLSNIYRKKQQENEYWLRQQQIYDQKRIEVQEQLSRLQMNIQVQQKLLEDQFRNLKEEYHKQQGRTQQSVQYNNMLRQQWGQQNSMGNPGWSIYDSNNRYGQFGNSYVQQNGMSQGYKHGRSNSVFWTPQLKRNHMFVNNSINLLYG